MSKTELLENFLAQKCDACLRQAAALTADDRTDEARFPKIQANVFGIFRTVLQAAVQNTDSENEMVEFFRERLRLIPSSWSGAHDRAVAHGDEGAAYIEELKLDAVRQIRKEMARIWEE